MTSNVRIRRVSSPAYYLARPAALWLAAFAPRPADRESCTSEGHVTVQAPEPYTEAPPRVRGFSRSDQPVCGCFVPAAEPCWAA